MYRGISFAMLSLSGNISVHSDWLIIMPNGRDMTCSFSQKQFKRNIVITGARFMPEITYSCLDIIRVCVSKIE